MTLIIQWGGQIDQIAVQRVRHKSEHFVTIIGVEGMQHAVIGAQINHWRAGGFGGLKIEIAGGEIRPIGRAYVQRLAVDDIAEDVRAIAESAAIAHLQRRIATQIIQPALAEAIAGLQIGLLHGAKIGPFEWRAAVKRGVPSGHIAVIQPTRPGYQRIQLRLRRPYLRFRKSAASNWNQGAVKQVAGPILVRRIAGVKRALVTDATRIELSRINCASRGGKRTVLYRNKNIVEVVHQAGWIGCRIVIRSASSYRHGGQGCRRLRINRWFHAGAQANDIRIDAGGVQRLELGNGIRQSLIVGRSQ